MHDSIIVKILLAPLSLLYGLGIGIRNLLYRFHLLNSISFSIPVISVGNLAIGGTGKTPHVEYITHMLSHYIPIAILSRGYKRKTSGFIEVLPTHNAEEVGDEPLQYKLKFPGVKVAVSESRVFGIPKLIGSHPDTQLVLLDDAFQHREVKPALNILLSEYARPYTRDFLLPSGRLREWPAGASRADAVIITKCPQNLTREEAIQMIRTLELKPGQKHFFSRYKYETPYSMFDPENRINLDENTDVLLVSAIARTDYLMDYIAANAGYVHALDYEDHHYYTSRDMNYIMEQFEAISSENKIILTTEKDAVRLSLHYAFIQKAQVPIFVLPIRVEFLFEEGPAFDRYIKDFLTQYSV